MHRLMLALGAIGLACAGPSHASDSGATVADPATGWCRQSLAIPERSAASRVTPAGTPLPPMSLAMSGGGYRAMLFHVGMLGRLNDAGLLPHLNVVSSVSGGSIVAGLLAHRWHRLQFDSDGKASRFKEEIETPLLQLAEQTLDIGAALRSMLPTQSAAGVQSSRLDDLLYGGALLRDIAPGPTGPELKPDQRPRPLFILNATSLQTGELWQFRPSAMGGPITHWTTTGDTRLSQAVAASSGFPPFLSPLELDLSARGLQKDWHDCVDERDNPYGIHVDNEPNREISRDEGVASRLGAEHWKLAQALRRTLLLVDGGVRDNLGLGTIEEINRLRRINAPHTAEHTVTLISDGGAATIPKEDPSGFWPTQVMRVMNIMADQPDEVRVANIVRRSAERIAEAGYLPERNRGSGACPPEEIPAALATARRRVVMNSKVDAYAYWSIRRKPKLHRGYHCPPNESWMDNEVRTLSAIPTRLSALPRELQHRLINWGYLAAHHGLPYVDYAWVHPELFRRWLAPCQLPYVGVDADGVCLLPLSIYGGARP